ncbi:PKD domain-containing protein [Carboxylicivirga sp. A043]|uniref:PKD domain-containing protein n=1 Tax=Carboxylicivirga litoralis TaxID=2816963 RepID=UPI0021CB3831|nr:PKD domain-containing protein [Carboxylicivirga sp. A043]MCU4154867.1 PKD domain-containing protein [Carboxylicivirga sp. A043]
MRQLLFIVSIILLGSYQMMTAQGLSVEKLPFSKKHENERAPLVKDSLLFFSSDKNVRTFSKVFNSEGNNLYNLMMVNQRQDSSWTKVEQYLPSYFSKYDYKSICFLPDSNEIVFTQLQNKDKGVYGIYIAKGKGDNYRRERILPFNSSRYSTAHPSISPDGRFMFFISDMGGGYGQTDIYVSERTGTEWGPAQNLGSQVNTTGAERFPFYHESGKLYFASDSLGGQGGFDIFYTYRTEDGWAKPVALDEKINTAANEFSCYIDASEQHGYFASDRDGDDDLFEFTYLFPVFGPGTKQKENTYTYRFYDRMNGKGDGPLKYVWYFGDGSKAEGDTVIHKYKAPGTYHVQSVLVDTIDNVELFVLNDFHQDVKKKIQVYINVPDEVKVGELQTLDALESNLGDFEANGFYWELPDGTKQKGETIQYIFRTKGKHIVKCGTISKHDPHQKMCTYKEINVIE